MLREDKPESVWFPIFLIWIPLLLGLALGFTGGVSMAMSEKDGPIQRLQRERDQARAAAETCLFGSPQTK